jgi:transposase
MTGSKKLTLEQRLTVIVKAKNGQSNKSIAAEMGINLSTVKRIKQKYHKTGSVKDKARSGRPRKTTPREDRVLIRMCLANRQLNASDIRARLCASHKIVLAVRTVRLRLQKVGLSARIALKKPLLTYAHRLRRKAFALAHRDWTVEQWKQVLWSDESKYQLFPTGRVIVRRRTHEKWHPQCIIPTVKFGGGSIMVWGCMSWHGVGQLYRCRGTMNKDQYINVLQNNMIPSSRSLFGRRGVFVFQHDNAPCHKAKQVIDFLANKRVNVMEWPPQSPDMNPIEHVWEILFRKVQGMKPSNLDELWKIVEESWRAIAPEDLHTLVESMPRRVQAVIKANGGYTKY